jgi:hypothetical protein
MPIGLPTRSSTAFHRNVSANPIRPLFHFKLSGESLSRKVQLGFDERLGDLTDGATQGTGDLSGTADLEFTLAIDLSQPVGCQLDTVG